MSSRGSPLMGRVWLFFVAATSAFSSVTLPRMRSMTSSTMTPLPMMPTTPSAPRASTRRAATTTFRATSRLFFRASVVSAAQAEEAVVELVTNEFNLSTANVSASVEAVGGRRLPGSTEKLWNATWATELPKWPLFDLATGVHRCITDEHVYSDFEIKLGDQLRNHGALDAGMTSISLQGIERLGGDVPTVSNPCGSAFCSGSLQPKPSAPTVMCNAMTCEDAQLFCCIQPAAEPDPDVGVDELEPAEPEAELPDEEEVAATAARAQETQAPARDVELLPLYIVIITFVALMLLCICIYCAANGYKRFKETSKESPIERSGGYKQHIIWDINSNGKQSRAVSSAWKHDKGPSVERPEVFPMFEESSDVEYFCPSRGAWVRGDLRISLRGTAEAPRFRYDVSLEGNLRKDVPLSRLRRRVRPGEAVEVVSPETDEWSPGRVTHDVDGSDHYTVRLDGTGEKRLVSRLDARRRYLHEMDVTVYKGVLVGWVAARIDGESVGADRAGDIISADAAESPPGTMLSVWVQLNGEVVGEVVPSYLVLPAEANMDRDVETTLDISGDDDTYG